jgi:4-carboxymuconolactone decarboxylase
MNIFTTLARHKSLFWPWLAFAGKLLAGKLSARHRELVILRTAYRCGCDYERRHHRDIALEAGFREEELDAIERDPKEYGWSESDRLVLDVVDELHADNRISDATWTRMRVQFSETQLIELVMLVGHYHMVAFTLNALRVEVEPGEPNGHAQSPAFLRAVRRMVLKGKRRSA